MPILGANSQAKVYGQAFTGTGPNEGHLLQYKPIIASGLTNTDIGTINASATVTSKTFYARNYSDNSNVGVWRFATKAQVDAAKASNPLLETPYADLSAVSGATINAFRQAYLIQTLLEQDARGGTRYVEILRAHFGVVSPDFRLQRPEYLGGGRTTINVHPVAQTTPTQGSNVQARGIHSSEL